MARFVLSFFPLAFGFRATFGAALSSGGPAAAIVIIANLVR